MDPGVHQTAALALGQAMASCGPSSANKLPVTSSTDWGGGFSFVRSRVLIPDDERTITVATQPCLGFQAKGTF